MSGRVLRPAELRAAARPPAVAVVVPTFERAEYLRGAVDSVLAQTFGDLILVVVDNASTDATADVLASTRDERLVHVRQERNVGLIANHNTCLELAERTGARHVLVLSDDDVLRPEHLARTVPVMEARPEVGMVHTRFDMVDADGRVLAAGTDWTGGAGAGVEDGPSFLAASMAWSCRVCSSTALVRLRALAGDRFREEDFPPIDLGLWLRLARRWSVAFVPETLASYRIHATSHSAALGGAYDGGYVQSPDMVDKVYALKQAVLADSPEPGDRARLLRSARAARRRELLVMARATTLPARRPGATAAALARAARVDPGVLLLPASWRLVGGSVLGRRRVEALQQRRRPA